jgi:hypothetical protein
MGSNVDEWFWKAEDRHQRRNERRKEYSTEDLGTLSAAEWLQLYGRRTESVLGSSQTIETAVA